MRSDFQFVALPIENFSHLFSMSDEELMESHGARRVDVDSHPGYPCRVSLIDAPIGERVILTPFRHHDVISPYQSAGPIFVRENAQTAKPHVNEIPVMFHHRLLSVRAYDEAAMMKNARVVKGEALEETIRDFFTTGSISYLHIHNAGPGCFNYGPARVITVLTVTAQPSTWTRSHRFGRSLKPVQNGLLVCASTNELATFRA